MAGATELPEPRTVPAPPTEELPTAARSLVRRLDATGGWTARVVAGEGAGEFGHLSEERNGDGKRHRVIELIAVESLSVRARHTDGRALVAVWIKRADGGGWKMDLAFRGRHEGEMVPRQITARQVGAYADAASPAAALAAIAELAPKAEREAAA